MSFIQRLKGHGVGVKDEVEGGDALKGVSQLEVDLYQTDKDITVFAPVAGADMSTIDIAIKGDRDIVEISGSRVRPEETAFNGEPPEGTYFTEEVIWGEFFRKIILPEPVYVREAEAKLKSGVLIIRLPLVPPEKQKKKERKLKVMDLDEEAEEKTEGRKKKKKKKKKDTAGKESKTSTSKSKSNGGTAKKKKTSKKSS